MEPQSEPPADGVCENCGKIPEDGDLSYYDNDIMGPAGWLCGECISNAEMEL